MLEAFLRSWAPEGDPSRVEPAARERLAAALRSIVAQGRAQWPDVTLAPDDLAVDVARRIPSDAADPAAEVERLRAADVYLACALGRGDAAAVRIFEREYVPLLRGVLGKRALPDHLLDDVQQSLREYILVGTHERPGRIHDYRGDGPLRNWLVISAVRMATRAAKRQTPQGEDPEHVAADLLGDAEVELIERRYDGQLDDACAHALQSLPDRERTLLRMQALDGATIDQIGTLYGVHRATAARWIARAKTTIRADARTFLIEQRGLPPEAADAVLELPERQLDVSVSRLLRRSDG